MVCGFRISHYFQAVFRVGGDLHTYPREFTEVLCGCCEKHLVAGAVQPAQPEAVGLEDLSHVREGHLDFLAFVAGAFEGRRLGQGADMIADWFVDIAGKPAFAARGALGLQGACAAIAPFSDIFYRGAPMGGARGFQLLAARADIKVAPLVVLEVGA